MAQAWRAHDPALIARATAITMRAERFAGNILAADAVLTWHYPRFPEFAERFEGVMDASGRGWEESNDSHRVTCRILREMGGLDVERSLAWIKRHGGCCDDVEVGVNIIGTWQGGPQAIQAAEQAHQ